MQIYNTMLHGAFPAPDNVNLARAVKLTARGLQASDVSVDAITVGNDCTLSVNFLVETGCQVFNKLAKRRAITMAKTKLAYLGIPQAALIVSGNLATDPSVVRVRCRFYVEPQECWPDVYYPALHILPRPKCLQLDVTTFCQWQGDKDDHLAFVGSGLMWQSADEFMRNVWRKFPWHMHWFLKDASYQVSPVSADGKSITVTYEPFRYGFGTVRAPACSFGNLGDLLFVHGLRPVLNYR